MLAEIMTGTWRLVLGKGNVAIIEAITRAFWHIDTPLQAHALSFGVVTGNRISELCVVSYEYLASISNSMSN